MNKKVKRILIISVVAICVIVGIFSATASKAIETTEINPKTAELTFTETGAVVSQSSVDVYSQVAGEIVSLNVQEGQTVNKGDLICRVDSSAYQYEIKQIESNIRSYEAQKGGASKDEQIRSQNIAIEQSERDLQRAREYMDNALVLYNNGAISKNEYDNAVNAFNQAQSVLEQNKEQLKIIENSGSSTNQYYQSLIDASRVSIQQLRAKLEDCNIKAPISGTVNTLNIKNTNLVNMQMPVATISTGGTSDIEVYVSTKDVDSVIIGETVAVTMERRVQDKEFTGIITKIDEKATTKISALGVEERKVKVTIGFDEASLKEGYEVDVAFSYYHEENKLIVPKTALFKENDEYMVWAIKKGKARKVNVEKGIELRTETVVEAGLTAGDRVVTDCNVAGLKEGAKIKI